MKVPRIEVTMQTPPISSGRLIRPSTLPVFTNKAIDTIVTPSVTT